MLAAHPAKLRKGAGRLARWIGGEVVQAVAKVGGGALPLLELTGPAVALHSENPDATAARLPAGAPPVPARTEAGRGLPDPRTMAEGEVGWGAGAPRCPSARPATSTTGRR